VGTYGAGLFEDDAACDVRDEWRQRVGEGASGPDATDAMVAEAGDLEDPEEACTFWSPSPTLSGALVGWSRASATGRSSSSTAASTSTATRARTTPG
jgi:hypothetical protein